MLGNDDNLLQPGGHEGLCCLPVHRGAPQNTPGCAGPCPAMERCPENGEHPQGWVLGDWRAGCPYAIFKKHAHLHCVEVIMEKNTSAVRVHSDFVANVSRPGSKSHHEQSSRGEAPAAPTELLELIQVEACMPTSSPQLRPREVLLCKVGVIAPVWWYSPGELNSVKRTVEPVLPSHTFHAPSLWLSIPFLPLSTFLSTSPSTPLQSCPPFFPLPFLHKSPLSSVHSFFYHSTPFHLSLLLSLYPNRSPFHSSIPLPIFHVYNKVSTPFPQKGHVLALWGQEVF